MFIFTGSTPLFRRLGLIALLCQLNCFVIGMPPFQAGIWVQSEPAVLLLYIAAAFSALWLSWGLANRQLACVATPPLMLALILWIAWQLLVTFAAPIPWRSWFGPPQTGDGAGMWIAILLTTLIACPLWENLSSRRVVLYGCAISFFIQCALHLYYPELPGNPYTPERWVPAQWPEYLPFIAGYLWVAAFLSGIITDKKRYALMALAMLLVLVVSCNKSAIGFFTAALLVTTAARHYPPARPWRIAAMLMCLLPFSLVLASPAIPVGSTSTGVIDRIFSHMNDGFGTRVLLDRVGLSVLQHEPQRLLIGGGWGAFSDDLFKYALVKDVAVYQNGERNPNWFLIDGSSHHSHNQPLEALLSMGLIGLAFWYALPMLALWRLPKEHFWSYAPMIAALAGLGHFWFQLPQCFPYQGLYFAALLTACADGKKPQAPGWKSAFAVTAACAAMAWSAGEQYRAMIHADRVHRVILTGSYRDYSEAWLGEDIRHGGDRWATSARYYVSVASVKPDANARGWYGYFLHNAHVAAANSAIGAHASFLEFRLESYLLSSFTMPVFDPLRSEAMASLEDSVIRLTIKAPLREDQIASYLADLPVYTQGNTEEQIRILSRILAVAPHHRSALWLLGRLYTKTEGKEDQGLAMVREAEAAHVEQVLFIPPLAGGQRGVNGEYK